jgi:hypothetical protein
MMSGGMMGMMGGGMMGNPSDPRMGGLQMPRRDDEGDGRHYDGVRQDDGRALSLNFSPSTDEADPDETELPGLAPMRRTRAAQTGDRVNMQRLARV